MQVKHAEIGGSFATLPDAVRRFPFFSPEESDQELLGGIDNFFESAR